MKLTGSVVGLLVLAAGIVGSWSVANYRITQAEDAIVRNHKSVVMTMEEVRKKSELDHEILVRIDERLKRVESNVTQLASRP